MTGTVAVVNYKVLDQHTRLWVFPAVKATHEAIARAFGVPLHETELVVSVEDVNAAGFYVPRLREVDRTVGLNLEF